MENHGKLNQSQSMGHGLSGDHGQIMQIFSKEKENVTTRDQNGGLQCIGEAFEKMPKYCTETCSQRSSFYRSCASGRLGRVASPIGCARGEMMCHKCKCNVKTRWGLTRLVRQGMARSCRTAPAAAPDTAGTTSVNRTLSSSGLLAAATTVVLTNTNMPNSLEHVEYIL